MEQEGWRQTDGIQNLLFYSKTDLTGNDISSQDSLGHRLSLFSKLLCLAIVHKGESISFSSRNNAIESMILESMIRDYTLEKFRIYTETRFTSRGIFLLSVTLATMTLLKLLNGKERGRENTKSSRDNQFSSAVRFSICIMFLFEKFHWM